MLKDKIGKKKKRPELTRTRDPGHKTEITS